MEKLDKKTVIGLLIVAVVIVVGIVCLALFNSKGTAATEEELAAATKAYEDYVFSMTFGYASSFGGTDKLYEKDSYTYDTLHRNVILNVAARYASSNLNNAISKSKMSLLRSKYNYDSGKYSAFDGDAMKQAVIILFGKELEHGSGINDDTFGYNFDYIPEIDIYLRSKSKSYFPSDGLHIVDYKTIKATRKDNNVTLTIAIAYTHTINDKIAYTNDVKSGKAIYETTKEDKGIKEDKIDEFPQYEVTFAIDEENNYVFQSIEKK